MNSNQLYKRVSFLQYRMALLLTIFSFLLFYYFKPDFMTDWDAIGYIKNISDHCRSGMGLGRVGFIYFYIPIWDACINLLKVPLLEAYHVVMFVNLCFSSLTIGIVYLLVGKVFRNKQVAFASAVVLIFSRAYISIAAQPLTEPMMIFLVMLSFFLFVLSTEKKNLLFFYLSAFIFGFAFEVKEAAMLSVLFFPAFIFTRKEADFLSLKEYLLFITIVLLTAFSMPLYFYLKDSVKYIHDIRYASSFDSFNFGDWQEIYYNLRAGFGILWLPLVGGLFLWLRKEFNKILIILSLVVPNVVFSLYGSRVARYFVLGYIPLAILSAYCFFYGIGYLRKLFNFSRIDFIRLFLCGVLILAVYNLNVFYRPMMKEIRDAENFKEHGLMLLNKFSNNTTYITGEHSTLMQHYYIPLTRSKKRVIACGWDWPKNNLGKVVERHLLKGRRVIIDLDGFRRIYFNEVRDVIKLMSMYKLKQLDANFIELYK